MRSSSLAGTLAIGWEATKRTPVRALACSELQASEERQSRRERFFCDELGDALWKPTQAAEQDGEEVTSDHGQFDQLFVEDFEKCLDLAKKTFVLVSKSNGVERCQGVQFVSHLSR